MELVHALQEQYLLRPVVPCTVESAHLIVANVKEPMTIALNVLIPSSITITENVFAPKKHILHLVANVSLVSTIAINVLMGQPVINVKVGTCGTEQNVI